MTSNMFLNNLMYMNLYEKEQNLMKAGYVPVVDNREHIITTDNKDT